MRKDFQTSAESEAAAWVARLNADRCGPEDKAAFAAWLERSPEHARAYEAAQGAWADMALLAKPVRARPPLTRRRLFLAAGGAAVAGGAVLAGTNLAAAASYRTGTGEQRRLSFAPGTDILMDADTHIEVREAETCRVRLREGCVHIRTSGPVTVARDWRGGFQAREAAFQVYGHGGKARSVLVLDGDGRFTTLPDAPVRIAAGQLYDMDSGWLETLRTERVEALTAWREGRAILRNERLTDVLRIMNRYDARPLHLESAAVGELRVSGVFTLGDNRRFAEALVLILPVQVEQRPSRFIIRDAKSS